MLLDALTAAITGQLPQRRGYLGVVQTTHHDVIDAATPQFEVMYLVGGCDAGALTRLRADLDGLGDSVALAPAAGDRHSVHVHTDDAGAAVEAGMAAGTVSRIRISALATGRVAPGGWSRQRAVLAGDNSDQPRLIYLPPDATVTVGDRVVTSGDGGLFPAGVPVGVVSFIGDHMVKVQPMVDMSRLEHVQLIDFGLPGGLAGEAERLTSLK